MALTPMMAQPLEVGKEKHAGQWERVKGYYYMEPKLDGWRILLDFTGKQPTAWTRTGRDLSDSLSGWFTTFDWDEFKGLVLDSEMGYPIDKYQIDYNATARVLGSGPEVALSKWETNMELYRNLRAYVFDMPLSELQQYARNRRLAAIVPPWHDMKQAIHRVQELGEWDEEKYTNLVEGGAEGVMLKNPDSYYHLDSRPTQTWYKVKKFTTTDAVVVSYDEGEGKYAGQIGAIVFMLEDGRVGRCSGMDDATRRDISDNRRDFLGAWMEIRYFGGVGRDKEGLRHPQFVRFRSDKETSHE
jgi:ATP-dependent DNA ligase